MSDYILVPRCYVGDAANLAKNNATAFWGVPFWRILWIDRTLESVQAAMAARLPLNLLTNTHVRRHQKVVHQPTGSIVGYSRWILPDTLSDEWIAAQTPSVTDAEKADFEAMHKGADFRFSTHTDELDGVVNAMIEKHRPKGPYIKLDYLAVHPDHHRRGIASRLLQSGIEAATQINVPIYVLSTLKESIGLYLGHGFQLLESMSQSLEKWDQDSTYDTAVLLFVPTN